MNSKNVSCVGATRSWSYRSMCVGSLTIEKCSKNFKEEMQIQSAGTAVANQLCEKTCYF